ncbi:MAG TPA: hypothetical protein VM241_02315 [Candidatus Thermoplasmatota archaeon]|nr:hypothetical protein [Candidatus Thermoplasmatota archaeon]
MTLRGRVAADPFSVGALAATAALTLLPLVTTQSCFLDCPPPRTISLLAEPVGVLFAFVLPLLGAAWLATSPGGRRGRILARLLSLWVVASLLAMVTLKTFLFTTTQAHAGAYLMLLAALVATGSLLRAAPRKVPA